MNSESDDDDDIVGEAVYDEEYLRTHKQRKKTSSSSELEGDDEYHWDAENGDDEEEDSLSLSEDSDEQPCKIRKIPGRTRRTKSRPVVERQSGLRRSRRASRNRINYRQYELSDSETEAEAGKDGRRDLVDEETDSDASEKESEKDEEYSVESQDHPQNDIQDMKTNERIESHPEKVEDDQDQPAENVNSPGKNETEVIQEKRFLDLNELAPGAGFDDVPNTITKGEDTDT